LTGFLGTGKTTLLNRLLSGSAAERWKTLVIQFEAGEVPLVGRPGISHLSFLKRDLERHADSVASQIAGALKRTPVDAVFVEWNGVTPYAELEVLFQNPVLTGLLRMDKVLHVADAPSLGVLMAQPGNILQDQIANSDFAVVRGARSDEEWERSVKRLLSVRPGLPVVRGFDVKEIHWRLSRRTESQIGIFSVVLLLTALIFWAGSSLLNGSRLDLNALINVFLGVILQAIPFLLIGVLLSSAIQVFLSNEFIERHFPKSPVLGMMAAIVGGFFLPVCDCASIPVFRSLVRKGVPLPAAVTFMVAAPVVNPVVILSTYYAFNGDISIVAGRVGLGMACAALIGLTFSLWEPRGRVLAGGARVACACGCDLAPGAGAAAKLWLFLRHAQAEFFDVGRYLIAGTFVSAAFQAAGSWALTSSKGGAGLILSIAFMMMMAFALSLCSSSDAVIARSFAARFPMGAIMGFLVFGPMMDIKNAMMLSSGFSKKFIARLTVTAFIVCLIMVLLYDMVGGV
jgi:uncharacterized membrane protein YraQ (UPF0718 family)